MEEIKKLPKVELHAHLSGSIPKHTYEKLWKLKYPNQKFDSNNHPYLMQNYAETIQKDLQDETKTGSEKTAAIFQVFNYVKEITDTAESIKILTFDVCFDFIVNSNCKVLEIRSQLKNIPTQQDYLCAVLNGIRKFLTWYQKKYPEVAILPKILFLPSINCQYLEAADETIELAKKFGLKGLDLSGNPCNVDNQKILDLLLKAKSLGLKLAVHLAEFDDSNVESLLVKLKPDRIGHGTHIHQAQDHDLRKQAISTVLDNKLPIEICLTSNLIAGSMENIQESHLNFWRDQNYLDHLVLCTDDSGVFDTTLEQEYFLAHTDLGISLEELKQMAHNAVKYSFIDLPDKIEILKAYFVDRK